MTLDGLRQQLEGYWSQYASSESDIDEGLRPWEREILSTFSQPGQSVLVVGCGTGRDVFPLVDMGYCVTGLDPAAGAIDVARQAMARRGVAGRLIHGYVEDVALDGQFDLVVFSDFSYSLIPGSQRRVDVLRKAARHLAPGGHIVLSVFVTGSHGDARAIRLGRAIGRWFGQGWRLEEGDQIAALALGDQRCWTISHAFTLAELEDEIARAGLAVAYRHPHVPAFVVTPA